MCHAGEQKRSTRHTDLPAACLRKSFPSFFVKAGVRREALLNNCPLWAWTTGAGLCNEWLKPPTSNPQHHPFRCWSPGSTSQGETVRERWCGQQPNSLKVIDNFLVQDIDPYSWVFNDNKQKNRRQKVHWQFITLSFSWFKNHWEHTALVYLLINFTGQDRLQVLLLNWKSKGQRASRVIGSESFPYLAVKFPPPFYSRTQGTRESSVWIKAATQAQNPLISDYNVIWVGVQSVYC